MSQQFTNLDQVDQHNTGVIQQRLHEDGIEQVREWLFNKNPTDRAYCSLLLRAYALDILELAQELDDNKMDEVFALLNKVKKNYIR